MCNNPATRRYASLVLTVFGLALLGGVRIAPAAEPDAGGDYWPQWRGPRRDNVSDEKGLLRTWPRAGPPLLWKAKGIGAGYAGVSVAGGRVYTMGDGPDAAYVRALDEATGRILWSAKVGPAGGGGGYPGPRCTPVIDLDPVAPATASPRSGRLYAVGQHGDLVCLKLGDGGEVWRRHMVNDLGGLMVGTDLQGRPIPPWGYTESPLVDGGNLVCTPGGPRGTLAALNKMTGDAIWRSKEWTDPAVYPSAQVVEIAGRRQYVQLTGSSLAGVDAADGKVLWRAERKAGTAVVATPVYRDGEFYATTGYGFGADLFKVTAEGTGASATFGVARVYHSKEMNNHVGGIVLVDGFVYGSDDPGILKCIDLKTGRARWKDRSVGKGSVLYADGHVYLRGQGGDATVALVRATPDGYQEAGRFDQPERSNKNAWPPPVIAGGKLYLRDQDVLLCYDVRAR